MYIKFIPPASATIPVIAQLWKSAAGDEAAAIPEAAFGNVNNYRRNRKFQGGRRHGMPNIALVGCTAHARDCCFRST